MKNKRLTTEIKEQLKERKKQIQPDVEHKIRTRAKRKTYLLSNTVYFALALLFIYFFLGWQRESIANIFGYEITFFHVMVTILFLVIIYSTYLLRRTDSEEERRKCFYIAVSGAEALEKGDLIEGSVYASKLFSPIKDFADSMKKEIGPWSSKVRELFFGKIEELAYQNKGVGKAIQNKKELRIKFADRLYSLAFFLFSESKEPDYNEALASLQLFLKESEDYHKPNDFMYRHRKIGLVSKGLVQLLKLTIVPILLFVLWLLFGYG